MAPITQLPTLQAAAVLLVYSSWHTQNKGMPLHHLRTYMAYAEAKCSIPSDLQQF